MASKVRHLVNVEEERQVTIDRICKLLEAHNVGYIISICETQSGVSIWANSPMTNAMHIEVKAMCLGVIFAIDHELDLYRAHTATLLNDACQQELHRTAKFVTLPSEEVL